MEGNQVSDDLVFDQLPPISSNCPWLVVENLDEKEDGTGGQIFHNLNDPLTNYHCRIPELTRKRIRGCNHGWVILSDNNRLMWSLWNPVNSSIIPLPPLILKDGDYESIRHGCLSAPPHDPSSVLVLTNAKKPSFVFCRVGRKRKRLRWIDMSYDKQLKRITGESEDVLILHSLTCCNGKVYALNNDNDFAAFVIKVDIRVKGSEVLIKLSLFGACPSTSFNSCLHMIHYLKGSSTELFYIIVAFLDKSKNIPGGVYSFKLDMTSKKCDEMEAFKDLNMTGRDWKDVNDWEDLDMTCGLWEELTDLKDAIFFVDVARDFSIFYCSNIASEFGGFIHIRGKMGKIMYSYHVKKKTIALSSMPSSVVPTSNNIVSMWECRLENEPKCTVDSKQEEYKDLETVVRLKQDESNKSQLINLPFPLLEMIMELCVGVEFMKFRATCKHCNLAAPVVKNYSLGSPWLLVVDKNQGILTITDPIFGDNYFMKKIKLSIFDERIYCSRFGWLLFYSCEFGCPVFVNPFTSDIRKLPFGDYFLNILCFSAPPTSPDCMVVGFSMACPEWSVFIHSPAGEPSWCRLSLCADPVSIRFPTFYGQDQLYALCNQGQLIVLKDLGNEDYSTKLFEAEATKLSNSQYFLVKFNQHILRVMVGECGEPVELFKWNNCRKEWEKIDGLGRHMIYVCDTTCVCIEAPIPEMENTIFFPRFQSKNKKSVFYSLETCRYHTVNDEESFGDFVGTEHHLNPHAWIEPTLS